MSYPNNILQQVQTYQPSSLAYLQNLNCLISTFNTKFKEFNSDISANLGSSMTFDKPYRFTTTNTLVAKFQQITQETHTLTVDNAKNTSYTITNQDQIFNLDKDAYMDKIGMGAMRELSQVVEANLGLNFVSGCPVGDIEGNPTGALHVESGPFRFFGNGITAINSYQQIQQAVTNFKNFGAVNSDMKFYLPDTVVPAIIGTGLNQFAPKRNDLDAMSWEIGEFAGTKYYISNHLPTHISGSVGNATSPNNVLTVVSTNDPTGANITQITFNSPITSDSNAIKSGDLFQFNWNVSGQPNLFYLKYTGHMPSQQPVQFRATANAVSNGSGNITVDIFPALKFLPSAQQNLQFNIVAGMKATVMPSHIAGGIVSGKAAFLAMPKLPDEFPYPTASKYDPDTGVACRLYYGSLFGQNQRGFVNDVTWTSTIVPEYTMRVLFPII